jgi:hypothetical protein
MQVQFKRWCVEENGRTLCSVNPLRVDCTEYYGPAFKAGWGEEFPAATKIIMKNKQEYVVQGELSEVVLLLNTAEREG